jgi:hypothetical protein
MTTTVTTAVTTITSLQLAGILGLITTLTVILLLIGREITSSIQGEHERRWGQPLNVALIPLALCFAIILGTRVVESL